MKKKMTWKKLDKLMEKAEQIVEQRQPQLTKCLPKNLKWNLNLVSRKQIDVMPKTEKLNRWSSDFAALAMPEGRKRFLIVVANDMKSEEEYVYTFVHEILHAVLFYKGSKRWNDEVMVEKMTERLCF